MLSVLGWKAAWHAGRGHTLPKSPGGCSHSGHLLKEGLRPSGSHTHIRFLEGPTVREFQGKRLAGLRAESNVQWAQAAAVDRGEEWPGEWLSSFASAESGSEQFPSVTSPSRSFGGLARIPTGLGLVAELRAWSDPAHCCLKLRFLKVTGVKAEVRESDGIPQESRLCFLVKPRMHPLVSQAQKRCVRQANHPGEPAWKPVCCEPL